jgi:hypothetical protein
MPASTFHKFNCFVADVGLKRHDLNADMLKVFLTNEQPLATDTVKGDMVEITAEHGYPAGGTDIQNTWGQVAGLATLTGVDVVFTASGGSFGALQWAVIYNDSGATKYLVGWYEYPAPITVGDGEGLTVDIVTTVATLQ